MKKEGPLNTTLAYIVETDNLLQQHYDATVTTLSEVRHLKQLRKGYIRTIETSERGPTGL